MIPQDHNARQGDQIGRIFAQCAIIYFAQIDKNYRSSPKFCATFFPSVEYVLILTKYALGYIFGDFFTNSSGHHDARAHFLHLSQTS
jgi:hypothetical protein